MLEPANLARENAALRHEIARLKANARRDTVMLNDAEENARVYRRLAYRLAEKCNALEDRLAALDPREDAPDAEDPAP